MVHLERFIEEQQAAGQHIDSGTFTLSLERAHETLRDFQLASPELYVLKLVQAAVAAGA